MMEQCGQCMRRSVFHRIESVQSFLPRDAATAHLVVIHAKGISEDYAPTVSRIREIGHIPILVLGAQEHDCGADLLLRADLSAPQIAAYATSLLCQYADVADWWEIDGKFPIVSGDFFVDQWNSWACVCGVTVRLPEELCRLLAFFLQNPQRLIPYQEIERVLWSYSGAYGRDGRDFVDDLRSKIEPDPLHPVYLRDIPDAGYRFREKKQS